MVVQQQSVLTFAGQTITNGGLIEVLGGCDIEGGVNFTGEGIVALEDGGTLLTYQPPNGIHLQQSLPTTIVAAAGTMMTFASILLMHSAPAIRGSRPSRCCRQRSGEQRERPRLLATVRYHAAMAYERPEGRRAHDDHRQPDRPGHVSRP